MRRFRAPGKLVLLGEYAVLDGAPALVVAVNRGVQVDVEPAATVELLTPGDDTYARAALAHADAPPGRYTFTAWNPVPTGTKAGFGGSAAATVAGLVAAWAARERTIVTGDLFREALDVHHRVQGSGSGIDIAASVWGEALVFANGEAKAVEGVPAPIVVWSGQSARTGPRVAQYLSWSERALFVEMSAGLVEVFPQDPIRAFRAAWELLTSMARSAGVHYETPALRRIVELAEAHGGGAKPSGAGGGDSVVALLPDPSSARDFRVACAKAGFVVIPVGIAPGVHEAPLEQP